MEKSNRERSYLRAKKRLDGIKSFYIHIIVYIVFNVFLLLLIHGEVSIKINGMHYSNLYTAIGWGVILLVHGIIVFTPIMSLMEKWEEKKLEEFMEEAGNNKWE